MYKTVIAPESSVSAPVSFPSVTLETLNSAIDQALLPHQHLLSSQQAYQVLQQPRNLLLGSAAASNIKDFSCARSSH